MMLRYKLTEVKFLFQKCCGVERIIFILQLYAIIKADAVSKTEKHGHFVYSRSELTSFFRDIDEHAVIIQWESLTYFLCHIHLEPCFRPRCASTSSTMFTKFIQKFTRLKFQCNGLFFSKQLRVCFLLLLLFCVFLESCLLVHSGSFKSHHLLPRTSLQIQYQQ